MGRAIFITGTDTGVGKTLVACALAALLRDSGFRVGVMKPVETGCAQIDGRLVPDDAVRLKQASGCEAALDVICPYPLRDPLAPSIAAERQAVTIEAERLIRCYREISSSHDVTLVEGAGGLMVPLLPSYTFADWARVLKLPVMVIAANRLGVINHLLLTLEHASCKGLSVVGYALNQTEPQRSLAAETNREALFTLTSAPFLGEIPYIENASAEIASVRNLFTDELDFQALQVILS